jgi:autotransporter-associated beta strand protein
MNGGTLNVVRNSTTNLYQDSFMLGLGTNSTGTFTLNGGTANFLCGIEIGINGSGILNVNGGTLIDNGWFHVGSGASKAGGMGSGTFNLTNGTVYILPNIGSPPTEAANNGGLAINQADTNAVVNISGGTLYCCRIGLDGNTGIPSTGSTDTLNISGGLIYVGYGGVGSNDNVAVGNQIQSVNISGGTFHTADILPSGGGGGVNGSTNNVLSDGTNWVWGLTPPVNLTNSIPGMGGVGHVTFAPEANCTISLKNVWSGQGGINVAGPGTLIVAGTNTYTGNTTVSGGELSLTGGGTIGNSQEIIVAGGAMLAGGLALGNNQTLIGSGTVNGTLSAGSGATIAPGSSTAIGTLTNTGSTLLQGGGTLTVKVQNATTGAGVGNDDLAVSGNIGVLATTGNKFTVELVSLKGTGAAGNVTNFNNMVSYAWTIATGTVTNFNAGAFTVDASGFSNPLGGGQFFVSSLGNSLVLYFDPAGTAGGVGGSISNPGMNGNGNPAFSGFGIPGYSYGVESETNLITGPWIEAGTVMAGTNNGSWSFTDTNQNNPPTIYYRLYYPDNPGNPPP